MGAAQLGADLTAGEVEGIVAFLESLTGDQPAVVHPILPPRAGGAPHPDQF